MCIPIAGLELCYAKNMIEFSSV